MPASTLDEQLTKYLTDAHSIEEQALQQLRSAPDLAGDPEIAAAFREHLAETERHERTRTRPPTSPAASWRRSSGWRIGWRAASTAPSRLRCATWTRTSSAS